MSSKSVCEVKNQNGVMCISFARPEARNAFNQDMRNAVVSALLDAQKNDEIKVVLLTGEGTSFSAGIDLKELAVLRESKQSNNSGTMGENTSEVLPADQDDSWALLNILQDFPKPIFIAVNGAGVGLGTTILGFADIAIAAESARFKCPFTEMGVGAEASSTWLLPQLVGWQNASWLLLSSEWVTANEAKKMGLVYDVVPDDKLMEVTTDMAEKIATRDLASIMAIKQTMNSWRSDPITLASKQESERFIELLENMGS